MMENREYLNSLFDIYAYLLTKTEQETFEDYYMEDLSLQEIADNKNISKSSENFKECHRKVRRI